MPLDQARTARGALAGAVAAGVWAAQQPLDKHVFDWPYDDAELLGRLMLTGADLAKKAGYADGGYRVVMNVGKEGGQVVFHVHLHVLAGRQMGIMG